jgi:hypothetical protein
MDGEWEAPQIDNPAFKGEWKPKQVRQNSDITCDFKILIVVSPSPLHFMFTFNLMFSPTID